MTASIEIDQTRPLLAVVRFASVPTDAEFQEYLRKYSELLDSQPRFAAVFVTAPGLPMTAPRHARWQAEFMKERRRDMEQRIVGVAFSLSSPVMRGVLRGILMLQPMPCPHTVVTTEHEGVSWAKAKLWSDHVRRLKDG